MTESPNAPVAAPLADADARRLALDTRQSAIVEAPAGSGKTGLLTQRFLKLLLEDSVTQPEEVMALTFTNKAAAEMRERVLDQLRKADDQTPLSPGEGFAFKLETRRLADQVLLRDAALQWNLLARPQRLNLRTLDSLAAEIANSLPLLSGAGAPRQPSEEPRHLYLAAARRTLDQLGGPDQALDRALRDVLLHRDLRLRDCEQLLASMLSMREQWGELVPLAPGLLEDAELDRIVRPRLEAMLESIVCAGLARAAHLLPAGVLQELSRIAAAAGELPGYGGDNPFALCAQRNLPPEAIAGHLDHWVALIGLLLTKSEKSWRRTFPKNLLSVELDKQVTTRLKQLVTEIEHEHLREALAAVLALPPARYPDDQWRVARSLFRVLRHALAELRLLFAERGECDFTELGLAALQALRQEEHASDLALPYGGRLRHLLVDEMQDTSAGQYELITLLTRSFDGHSQTLFLVGDPKQSIYLFRQARVERFLHTLASKRLGDVPLVPLRLTSNFRSQGALVEQFNEAFAPLFAPADDAPASGEIAFVAATPTRALNPASDNIRWHRRVLPARTRSQAPFSPDDEAPEPLTPQGLRAAQAREVREVVEDWRNRPLPPDRTAPWTIAVLARSRSHLNEIVAEFKRDYGRGPIPYRAVRIDPLGLLPEVSDALALTRALLHPADRVAWLAVLRAPWCGLSMADLLALTGEGVAHDPDSASLQRATVATLIQQRSSLLSPQGQRLLARAWPVLEQAVASLGSSPLALHVERTWRSLGGDLPLHATARDNVRRFLALLHELTAGGGPLDMPLLDTRLQRLYAEPAPGDDAVELMTMHNAKGLEWDVVLAPQLERSSAVDRDGLLNWIELEAEGDAAAGILLAPIASTGGQGGKLNDWIRVARNRRSAAERKRLFYVACTRAKEELHLFGTVQRKQDQGLCAPLHNSLLHACWPYAQAGFEAEAARLAAAPPARDQTLDPTALLEQEGWFDELGGNQEYGTLSLAAGASDTASLPLLERLPASVDPGTRFLQATAHRLAYPTAAAPSVSSAFDRPEGSFAVRAFGNVLHRYLERIAALLSGGLAPDALAADLPTWAARLAASLRAEGLPPTQAQRDAARALEALQRTLADPIGRWLLAPSGHAVSEREMAFAGPGVIHRLRADRILTAAATPPGLEDQLPAGATWIVDFKSAEQGARSDALFERQQRERYSAQLASYAASLRALDPATPPIILALYYPLPGKLIWWHDPPPDASNP